MNYGGKHVVVTGASGFIGGALAKRLRHEGAIVSEPTGDLRDPLSVRDHVTYLTDYVFHFGSPSSQIQFRRNIAYGVDVTINGFLNVLEACRRNNAKLIYPSTGLLSQHRENEYARCKKVLEDIHLGSDADALGLRIFAGYGIGEDRKRDYASIPFLFVRDVMAGRRPVVYGDGSQVRDFIYIDDVVTAIIVLAEEAREKIVDVGSGKPASISRVLEIVKSILGAGVDPELVEKPAGYVEETLADTALMSRYGVMPRHSLEVGIGKVIEYEQGHRHYDNQFSH